MEIIGKAKEVADLLYNTTGMSISFLGIDGSYVSIKQQKDASYHNNAEKENMIHLFQTEISSLLPSIRTLLYQNYIGIPINKELGEEGILILGPSVYYSVPDQILESINAMISIEEKGQLLSYYNELPCIPFSKLNHIACLAFYMLYQRTIEVEEVLEYNFYHNQTVDSVWGKYDESFSFARQHSNTHHSYKIEKMMFECIKKGDTKTLLTYLNKHMEEITGSHAGKDPIRANKNIAIGYAAIACRIAIEAGTPSELMYRKNDIYIQLIDDTQTIEAIQSLLITTLCDYANMVKKMHGKEYSSVVKCCIDYIFLHLFDEISVKQMAGDLHFNDNYLSRIFKEEVGKTISEFIAYEKIEEAKRLLVFTDLTIIYISVILNFHDQSHFTRVFKKETGMTPRKYRNQYITVEL